MIDLTTVANISGTFPNIVTVNETIPDAGDGTPLVKKWVDDHWGFQQAVLNHAGTTPSGVNESASVSQVLNGLISILSPVGSVIAWHGNVLPQTLGHRLLHLDGSGVLRSSYTDLDAACYVGDANNNDSNYEAYYRADDSGGTSRNTSGIYLILPDMEFASSHVALVSAATLDNAFPKFNSTIAGGTVVGTYTCKWCVRY
jgi:hypothetical protein